MDDWDDTDFYAALGVPRTATAEEIKRAFRILARELHPDLHPADWTDAQRARATEHLQVVLRAWDALKDPARRARYDDHLRAVELHRADAERAAEAQRERERARASADYERARREQSVRWEAATRERAWQDQTRREAEAREAWARSAAYWAALLDALTEPRRGADVYAAVELDDAAWRRGQTIRLPYGGETFFVEPMTGPGWYVYPGRGGPGQFGGPRGDLYVAVQHRFTRPPARVVPVRPTPAAPPLSVRPAPAGPGPAGPGPGRPAPAGPAKPAGVPPRQAAARRRRRGWRTAVLTGVVLGTLVVILVIGAVLALLRLFV